MKVLFLAMAMAVSLGSYAQSKGKGRTIETSDTILYATVDRPGELYVVTVNNHIQRFDQNGKLQAFYKSERRPTLFEPGDGARIFAYFRDLQQYWIFSPAFDISATHTFDSSFAIEPWLICPSGDYHFWILDGTDNSLKKVNTKTNTVPVDVSMNITSPKERFVYMRDYQNFLFVLEKGKGILIFNSIGKLVKTIPSPAITYFNFMGSDLYYVENSILKRVDIFFGEAKDEKLSAPSRFVLFGDARAYYVDWRSFEVRENH